MEGTAAHRAVRIQRVARRVSRRVSRPLAAHRAAVSIVRRASDVTAQRGAQSITIHTLQITNTVLP